ncbi:MAG: periplasmic heavy metal sensor [Gemmatimonadetes bacterium]|nr:periplasmic heavy metal sensor [Gemmatimonadota bacterium]
MNEIVKRPWKAGVLLLAVFLAGALVGGVIARLRPPMQGRDANGMLRHLTEELDLTQVQQDSIKAVLDRYRPAMDSAWAEVRPRIETVRARIRSDIAAQLTADQRAKYEEMMKHHDDARQNAPRRP